MFEIVAVLIIGAAGIVINMMKKRSAGRKGSVWTQQSERPHAQTAKKEPVAAASSASAMSMSSSMPSALETLQPTVHTHLDLECEIHDQAGSLGVVSDEGKDFCHEEQLVGPAPEETPAQAQPGLKLEWTGENMVKAFVMQEILTRPCQRRR